MKLHPKYLKRYAKIANLLIKYGRQDLVDENRIEYDSADPPESTRGKPEELANDLEQLGPTFVKLGQLLSTRPDILPVAYLEPLQGLQDDVSPISVDQLRDTIESELGVRISNAFGSFDDSPLAAASMAQVHRATLRSGEPVVVKVLRPGSRDRVIDDLTAINEIAMVFDSNTKFGKRYGFLGIAESLEKTMRRELDLRIECRSTERLRTMLTDYENLVVPRVFEDYSSASVLTMEYVPGTNITEVSPSVLVDVDGRVLAKELFDAYLHQVLVEGHFHADPHPGNILLTHSHSLAIIDCGMMVHVDPDTRGRMINLLLAVSEGRGEDAAIVAEQLGTTRQDFDSDTFRGDLTRIVAEHRSESVGRMQVGQILMSMQSAAGGAGLDIRHEVRMLGKTLMNLDRVVEVLDPSFDPAMALQMRSSKLMQQHSLEELSIGRLFRSALETTDLLQHLPSRVNKITELLAENKIEIKADAVDEEHLVRGLQHIANRVTVGLLLAAMVVGAALMMRIETEWQVLGYPGIAMLLFSIAALASFVLILRIFLTNHRR